MSDNQPQGRDWMKIIAVVLTFFIVLNVISFVWIPFFPWFQQRDAGEQIMETQIDAEKALENYRWFRQQWQDIQAQRAQIQNYYQQEQEFYEIYGKDPSNWSRQAETRHSRIQTRITGSQNQLEQMIADYNARSADATRSMFKCHLPFKVDERFVITGPPGSGSPEQPQDRYINGSNPNATPPKPSQCDGLPAQVRTAAQQQS